MSIYSFIKNKLSNAKIRNVFVREQLTNLPANSKILDAGCGSQQYRQFCDHLEYRAQDFGQYVSDSTAGFASKMGGEAGYQYGKLDYIGDIWSINEADGAFDAILCTEVFEHIPFPNETVQEFSRLLRPGGKLILTLPSNCLRHMDPYYYYSGFSDHYVRKMLMDNGMDLKSIEVVGDYYSWIAVELARTMKHHAFISAILLFPAFLWYFLKSSTPESKNTLCMGYHVVALKRYF
jgi:SAM-dependent methyltransferase